jgi:hypothetical protein
MDSRTAELLLEEFQGIAPDQAAGGGIGEVVAALGETAAQGTATGQAATSGTSSGGGSTVGTVLETVFKNALGMVPLVRGLMSLFGGGGGTEAPAPLVKYAMPAAIQFRAADTAAGIGAGDYDQMGMPRAYSKPAQAGTSAPQVTVNVQAMDARSFLDHSGEIAQAVREAMLNLSPLNDVVNEL